MPLADQPTMAQALWSTVRELRMAGVKSDDLKAEAFESPAKHAELRALLAAYERHLEREHRGDMAIGVRRGAGASDWCPIQPQDCWTELPDAIWTPLQRRLIDAMPGERISPRALALPGRTVPRRLAASHDRARRAGTRDESSRVPDDAGSVRRTLVRRIELFHAGGREAEIEEVFRRILDAGVSLDQVEIACASDAHVALVWEKALRHDWPVTLGPGIAAAQTRPGRALIGLCDWIETDFAAGHFRRLLQSGDLGVEAEDEGFTAGQAARLLARAEAGWGRATYGLALGRLRQRLRVARGRSGRVGRRPRRCTRRRPTSRHACSPGSPASSDRFPSRRPTARSRCRPSSRPRSGSSNTRPRGRARSTIARRRRSSSYVARAARPRVVLVLAARGAALHPRTRAVAAGRARASASRSSLRLHAAQAGYAGRPHVFVVGLEEGRVFPSATEEPVLLDAERAAISPALRSSTDRIDEAVYAVLARLAVSGAGEHHVQLFVPRHREFRETYASWLMLQAFRLQQGDPGLSYQQMKAALGEPKSVVSADRRAASSSGGWWLRSVVGTGSEGVDAVGATFGGVALGRKAAAGARVRRVHRVRRLRARGRRGARSVRARHRALGHGAGEGRGVSVPLLPEARPRHSSRRRARARQGCLARSADARLRAARPVCVAAAPVPRRRAAGPTRDRTAPG